jgi:hypothetical protein
MVRKNSLNGQFSAIRLQELPMENFTGSANENILSAVSRFRVLLDFTRKSMIASHLCRKLDKKQQLLAASII